MLTVNNFKGLSAVIVLLGLSFGSMAQTPIPTNFTSPQQEETSDAWLLLPTTQRSMTLVAALRPLTTAANTSLPTSGISGPAVLADPTNQLNPDTHDIVLISCDPSDYFGGNIDANYLIQTAESAQVSAIILYSQQADYCDYGNGDAYSWLYTLQNRHVSQEVLSSIKVLEGENNTTYISIDRNSSRTSVGGATETGSAPASSSTSAGDDGGPPPSTAVAMIILYSITGIITCLFLIIIITGAVRAHRHPERYGPRNILGRPRQSRAQGLARAMLDSLPIVKVGEQERPKPNDVELAGNHGQVQVTGDSIQTESQTHTSSTPGARDCLEGAHSKAQPVVQEEGGIAPATAERTVAPSDGPEIEGCSICTEDFELGQDQRVLPCNHRFHPACIDPWLLNISGTCPLCRIDLRPSRSSTDEAASEDSIDGMAPPLGLPNSPAERERLSVRRSLMLSIMGMGQPERMSRQQRVIALREYNRRRAQGEHGLDVAELSEVSPEEETSAGRRLRNAFRIRTRRTGQGSDNAGTSG